ncbi:MAG TPA: diacylglycerol kinase family protein [Terriglobales bacterium]|jgi:diacylglycerol kinase (ATP)|nr:diacylglycerol kinase family protein [Terriglobales bacterium]
MNNVRVLYNPRSGGKRRHTQLAAALSVLHDRGIQSSLRETLSSAQATHEARIAVEDGCDTVVACGGDGTISDVTQSLVGTDTALGILPFGTANALAHDLRLPMNPVAAIKVQLTAKRQRVAVGKVRYRDLSGKDGSRYFAVALGIGVDAHLFYKLQADMKQRLGMAAYYAKAWQLWTTHRMRPFAAEYRVRDSETSRRAELTELLAVRITNFGGVVRTLAPGASLMRDDLRLVLCRSNRRATYLHYVFRCLVAGSWNVRGIDLVHADQVLCKTIDGSDPNLRIYVEADGELLGTLPVEIEVVRQALTILIP